MDKGTSPGTSRGRGAAGTGENAWRGRGRGRGQNQRQENVNIELGHGRGRGGRGRTIGGGEGGGKPTPETQPQLQSTRGGRGWGTSNNMSRGRGLSGPITGKRQMEFMPSISRSSGLDKDGDSLKNFKVQEEYRAFIEEKLERVLGRRKTMSVRPENDQERKHRVEEQENVLILFRKLREGVSSSNRTDSFSHEVYERSLYLSILFDSPKHTTAIIPALIDDLYPKSQSQTKTNSPFNHISQLISLIHHLTSTYPSQNLYYQQRQRLNSSNGVSVLPNETDVWLESLAKSLRTGNYHQFSILTRPETKTKTSTEISISTFMQLPTIKDLDHGEKGTKLHKDLAIQAFLHSLECLRVQAREMIWSIIRVGYRELWFDEDYDTTSWLDRSLCLGTLETSVSRSMDVKQWMANAGMKGQVHKKEDMEGRWIVVKPN